MIEVTIKEQRNRYSFSVGAVKKYGDRYKVTYSAYRLAKGMTTTARGKRGEVNEEKLLNNLRRARNTIKELALCNDWDYFCTLTLDKSKMDRYNLSEFNKRLGQFIRDERKRTGCNIKYLLIPEQHKDGAWHIHGLLKGLPKDSLVPVQRDLRRKRQAYNWIGYSKKFGFSDLEKIEDIDRVSSYITKYVTKNLGKGTEQEKKSYYASRGLMRSEEIKKGTVSPKYRPEYQKLSEEGTVLYSEMWLHRGTTQEEALTYVRTDDFTEIVNADGQLVNYPVDMDAGWLFGTE